MSGKVNETAIWEKDDGGLARMAAREVGSGGLGFWLYFEAGTKVIDRFGMWVMRRKKCVQPDYRGQSLLEGSHLPSPGLGPSGGDVGGGGRRGAGAGPWTARWRCHR